MPRGSSMFPAELFNDEGFGQLEEGPQRLFMWLWIHPDLNGAGIIAIQHREWASAAAKLTEAKIETYASTLRREGWVDYGDGQLWLRPYMKLDGALKSPTVYVGATRAIKTVRSRRLREVIWQLFRTFPMPLSPLPKFDDDPDGKKAKRIKAMNDSVELGYAELEQHMTAPGVRESLLPIPPRYPLQTVSTPSVGVGVDVGGDVGHPPQSTRKSSPTACNCGSGLEVAPGEDRCAICLGKEIQAAKGQA